MKRLICIFILFFAFAPKISAADTDSLYSEFNFSELYDTISDDAKNELGKIEDFNTDSISPKGIISYVLSAVSSCILPFFKDLAILFTFLCTVAFIKKLCDGFSGFPHTQKCVSYAVILALSLMVYNQLNSDFKAVNEFLLNIQAYYASAVPIMTGMYALGGNTAQAAANGAVSTVMLSVASFLCKDLVLPAARLNFALSLASFDTIKLGYLTKTVTGFCSKFLAVTMGLVASGMLLSVKLASSADGIGIRVLKFAASSFVPIVGSALSEATTTLTHSVQVIRSGFGIFGIAVILYMIVPIIVRIWVGKFAFSLASSFANFLDCKNEGTFLGQCSAIYSLALSALFGISMCFVLALTVFVNTAAVK